MELKVDKSESFKWAIVVDEKNLRRLDETIKSIMNQNVTEKNINLTYHIQCSDGSKVETDDINEVVNEENLKTHSIDGIKIIASSTDRANSIEISLGDKGIFQTTSIIYSITGDSREWVYLAASKIEERIENLRQWYSFFVKLNSAGLIGLIGLILYFMVVAPIIFLSVQPSEGTDVRISFVDFTVGIFGLVVLFITIYLIYKLVESSLKYLFPTTAFRIGEGIKRHDAVIDLRGKLFWAIFVGLIISTIPGVILLKIA